jgi:mannitol/fructose-specific phosphotransferase system IIA component (Ntr-type)/Kef-type K+ transport system membrane component KefB
MFALEFTAVALDNLVPIQMMTLGLLILGAHLGGKLFERMGFSVVTGQLMGGVLVGPWALRALGILPEGAGYEQAVESFSFYTVIFVSLVAFSIGEELHLDRLRHVGRSTLAICLIQTSTTFVLVSTGLYFLGGLPLIDALIIGSIGMATSPAVTFVILNRLRIEGRLRNILGSVEVLSDVLGVIVFSFLVQLAAEYGTDHEAFGSWGAVKASFWPVMRKLLLAHLIGAGIYLLLRLLVRKQGTRHISHDTSPLDTSQGLLSHMLAEHPSPSIQIFMLVAASVSLGTGLAYYFHLPFFATAAFAGFLIANLHSRAIFDSLKIDSITSLLNLTFFALLGSMVRFDEFDRSTMVLIPIYIITRAAGKILGTWLGCKIMKEDRKITSCLPYLLLPQAGVAAVEAVYAATILGHPIIRTVMLPSIVIFEIAGVLMSDHTLQRWRSWVVGEEEVMRAAAQQSPRSQAIDRILSILSPSRLMLGLDTPDKATTIAALVAHAAGVSESPFDQEEAIQLIKEREKLMPTGMGHGIAIPHCRLLALRRPTLVFARHQEGIVFGGVDNAPCRLIVLILSGAGAPDEHVRLLGAMAHLLGKDETRKSLLAACSTTEFIEVIQDAGQG